jgi:hypothetical protein
VASPLFDPRNRPKPANALAETELLRLEKARQQSGNVIISVDTCPGLFLLTFNLILTQNQSGSSTFVKYRFPVPRYWKRHVSKIHLLLPAKGPLELKNGSQIEKIPAAKVSEILGRIQYGLEQDGFQVVLGAPSRFERADVI